MEKSIGFDKDLLDRVLSEIYNEEVKPSEGEIPQELFDATRDIFEQATAEGFANGNLDVKGNENYLQQYTHSVEVFSTFRVHTYAEMLASKLHDEEGNLRSFQEWKKETTSIQSHFNENWLRTEYNTAILRAEQAADWRQFEKDKDIMPNLKWMPTSSATPREEHAVFWRQGLTLPVDDKFWDEHHPGDLWNCKCWLEQTDAKATTKKEMPAKKEMPKPAKGLKSNPGKKAEMYDDSHPYYPDPKTCLWLRLAKQAKQSGAEAKFGKFFNSVKCPGNCNNCALFNAENLCDNARVLRVGKGKIKIHPKVDESDRDYDKLMNVATYFAKQGKTVMLTPKMSRPPKFRYEQIYGDLVGTEYEGKCPDLNIDGVWYEHEGFITDKPKNAFRNMLTDGLLQSSRLIIDNPNLTDRYMIRGIQARICQGKKIDEVWIMEKDGDLRLLFKNTDG